MTYDGDLSDFIDWSVYFYGMHERNYVFFLERILRARGKQSVFIDIGANSGHHSLYLSQCCKQVYAFEPFPPLVDKMKKRMRRNNIENVSVHALGIGSKDKEKLYYYSHTNNKGTGSFVNTDESLNAEYDKLKIVDGSAYFESNQIKHADVIKIDVEGYEPQVLKGLKTFFEKTRPIVCMEFNQITRLEIPKESVLLDLIPQDYVIKEFHPKGKVGYEIKEFNFTTANGDIVLLPKEQLSTLPH